ncbi:probable G-protein coupled receptor 156 isoform X3 [Danio rerio]|uniref:Probable G-protein coupled receptor 156 isoform X3 n=1 Tax=Danio rerio TaxID=7955 RepID=A0AC58GFW8_DANRE
MCPPYLQKNAVIDSLQEQVNNAKDKLLKLMTASQLLDEREMDSSNTNLNSTSTQTTVVSPDSPTLVLKQYSEVAPTRVLSPPPYVPPPPIPIHTTSNATSPEGPGATDESSPHLRTQGNSFLEVESLKGNTEDNIRYSGLGKEISEKPQDVPLDQEKLTEDFPPPASTQFNLPQVESPVPSASVELPAISPAGRLGFVTNEQLVEILQDLSIDAVSSSVKSPDRARSPSINPDELSMTLSPQSPLQFFFPPISPYVMRKRRPPFYSSKGGPPPYYFPGSVPPGRRRGLPDLEKFRDDDPITSSTGNPQRHDLLREERRSKRAEKAQTQSNSGQDSWQCSSHKCSITPFMGHVPQPASAGLIEEVKHSKEPYDYSDSDSSSSEDYCYYQRSYCRACHHPYDSTDSLTSGTSDSEDEDFYRLSHPVVNFKVDVKPTFV